MRDFKLLMAAAFILLTYIVSCSKDEDPILSDTANKLVGVWNIQTAKYDYYYSGIHNYDTIICGPGNTIEFKSNGISYINFLGGVDTLDYKVINDNKIIFNYTTPSDADTFSIRLLTQNELTIAIRLSSGNNYDEAEIYSTR